jgi:hypothetical protein
METTIKAYSKIEAGIAALQQQYSHRPDCSTTAGFEQCKKDYRSIRKVETSLEKERKIQGEEARKHVALVNTEAKAIQEQLETISEPFKNARDDHQEKVDKKEADRVAGIKERIQGINNFVLEAHGTDSEGVSGIIESIDLIDCADNFDEFTAEALKTKQEVLEQLGQILQQKAQAEAAERDRLAAEQGRLEAERKAAIDQRINNLRMIPLDYMNKTSKEISAKIDSLMGHVIPAEEFGDRYQEAAGARTQVIEQLGVAFDQAVKLEEAEQIKADQAEFDRRAAEAEATQPKRNYIKEVADSIEYGPAVEQKPEDETVKAYLVVTQWSGYSRGCSEYRVLATSEEEAKENWHEGSLVSRHVVRDDTEVEGSETTAKLSS